MSQPGFLTQFEDKMTKLNNVRANIQNSIQIKEAFASQLKTRLEEVKNRLQQLTGLINTLKTNANNLESQIGTNTTSISDKERELQQLREQVSILTTEKVNLTTKITQQENELKNQIAQKQNLIDTCEAQLREIKTKYESQTREVNALREEITKNGNEKDAVHAEQLRKLSEQSQKQLTDRENELLQKINDCDSKISSYEQQLKDKNVLLEQKQKEIDDAAMKTRTDAVKLQSEIDKLKSENEQLVKRLISATDAINQAADDLQLLMAEVPNAQTKQQIETLVDEINQQINQSIQNIGTVAEGQYNIDTNFNNLMQLHSLPDKAQYLTFIKNIRSGQLQNDINQNINLAERGNKTAIDTLKRILETNKILVNPPRNVGGKRRVTHKNKKQKGGFVYSSSSKRKSISPKTNTSSRRTSRRSSRRSSR